MKRNLFFPYDLKRYRTVEDRLQLDYEAATPGVKCVDQRALAALEEVLAGADEYHAAREGFLGQAFFEPNGRSARLWQIVAGTE